MHNNSWIGVDLDGTLAMYDDWVGHDNIGEPIPKMMDRVKAWMKSGKRVKIFTARATDSEAIPHIRAWLEKHGIGALEITFQKDYLMHELWDDRAIQIIKNTGERADGLV